MGGQVLLLLMKSKFLIWASLSESHTSDKDGMSIVFTKTYVWPDFGKPTKLSHLVFREIPILDIQATVVPLC